MRIDKALSLKALLKSVFASVILMTSMSASAELYYSLAGEISEISSSSIRLDDNLYAFMPTVKFINSDGKSMPVTSLKRGDIVKVTILKLDDKKRVDTIQKMNIPR